MPTSIRQMSDAGSQLDAQLSVNTVCHVAVEAALRLFPAGGDVESPELDLHLHVLQRGLDVGPGTLKRVSLWISLYSSTRGCPSSATFIENRRGRGRSAMFSLLQQLCRSKRPASCRAPRPDDVLAAEAEKSPPKKHVRN